MPVPRQEYDSCYPLVWCVSAFDIDNWLRIFFENFFWVQYFCDITQPVEYNFPKIFHIFFWDSQSYAVRFPITCGHEFTIDYAFSS